MSLSDKSLKKYKYFVYILLFLDCLGLLFVISAKISEPVSKAEVIFELEKKDTESWYFVQKMAYIDLSHAAAQRVFYASDNNINDTIAYVFNGEVIYEGPIVEANKLGVLVIFAIDEDHKKIIETALPADLRQSR